MARRAIPLKYSCEEIYERMSSGLCIICEDLDTPGHHDLKHKGVEVIMIESVDQPIMTEDDNEPIVDESLVESDDFVAGTVMKPNSLECLTSALQIVDPAGQKEAQNKSDAEENMSFSVGNKIEHMVGEHTLKAENPLGNFVEHVVGEEEHEVSMVQSLKMEMYQDGFGLLKQAPLSTSTFTSPLPKKPPDPPDTIHGKSRNKEGDDDHELVEPDVDVERIVEVENLVRNEDQQLFDATRHVNFSEAMIVSTRLVFSDVLLHINVVEKATDEEISSMEEPTKSNGIMGVRHTPGAKQAELQTEKMSRIQERVIKPSWRTFESCESGIWQAAGSVVTSMFQQYHVQLNFEDGRVVMKLKSLVCLSDALVLLADRDIYNKSLRAGIGSPATQSQDANAAQQKKASDMDSSLTVL